MIEANVPRLRIAVLVTALAMSSVAHGYAQIHKGAFEVGVEVGPSIFIATGGHELIGSFLWVGEPHLDYFLTEELAAGVTGFFYRNIEDVENRFFFVGAYGHINYFFSSSSRISPYIGARLGVFKPDSEPLFGLGPQIGLKFFVTPQFSINGQLDGAIHQASNGTLFLSSLVLGLSYHI